VGSADEVKEVLRKASKDLHVVDDLHIIDVALLSSMTMQGTSARLVSLILEAMPAAAGAKTLAVTMGSLGAIKKQEVFKLSSHENQQKLCIAMELLAALQDHRKPDLEAAAKDKVLGKLVPLVVHFLEFNSGTGAIRGVDAFASIVGAAEKALKAGTASLEDIWQLKCYAFFVPQELQDRTKKVIIEVQTSCCASLVSVATPSKNKADTKTVSDKDHAHEAALAFFHGP
jgi:hypothetical protein